MSNFIKMDVINEFYDAMEYYGDHRVKGWFMMSSPWPTIISTCLYIVFVKKIGPKWMQYRKAFNLTKIMLAYNIFQVIISTYMFYGFGIYGWFTTYNVFCEPADKSTSPIALGMLHVCYLYYSTKFVEFLDTIFFVLRKKNNQITNLHVIHHSIMPVLCWIGMKFYAGGSVTFFSLLNCFIHAVMYGYYLLAACGPRVQKYLWWKKYLTALQIVQFVLIILHAAVQLMIPNCGTPKVLLVITVVGGFLILGLFMNFYLKTYTLRTNKLNERRKMK